MLLLAVLAEAVLGHVHDLRAHLGVLELGEVDVLRAQARHLEGGRGSVHVRIERDGAGLRAQGPVVATGLDRQQVADTSSVQARRGPGDEAKVEVRILSDDSVPAAEEAFAAVNTGYLEGKLSWFFERWVEIMGKLEALANKELIGEP